MRFTKNGASVKAMTVFACVTILVAGVVPAAAFAATSAEQAGEAQDNAVFAEAANDFVIAENDGSGQPSGAGDSGTTPDSGNSPEGDGDDAPQPTAIDITGAKVVLSTTYVSYDGAGTLKPTVLSVTLPSGTVLNAATDYTISYENAAIAGTATVTVTGTGAYTGKATVTYNVFKADLKYKSNKGSLVKNGKTAGSVKGSTTLKKLQISSSLKGISGKVMYKLYIQGKGWTSYTEAGSKAVKGKVQAVRVKLTGKLSKYYNVYYRLNNSMLTWMGWAKNGARAGIIDMHVNSRAIQIKLVQKNDDAPEGSGVAFVSKKKNYAYAVNEMLDNVASQTSASSTYLILCSKTYNRLNIYKKDSDGEWERIKSWKCSTGKKKSQSRSGTFYVGSRGFSFDTSGNDGTCYYWTQWSGNYLFHSVIYKLHNYNKIKYGNQLGRNLSHGCVRLDRSNAKWIYQNIPSGTKVKVFGTVY